MRESSEAPSICPECNSYLTDVGPNGQCPVCLLRAGMRAEEPDSDETLAYSSIPSGQRFQYLGDYELIEEIGRGGMGVVFRATQTSLDRPVAVKVLMGGIWASEEARQRFKLEAKAAAAVKHPSIVAVHEVGEHEGQPYFSMDLIEGEDLGKRLARETPSPEQAALWMREIAAAVEEAHQCGVVHRDLKPSNIILDVEDRPLVTDFGLARFEGPSGLPLSTLTGQILGTPGFLAPERLAGEGGDGAGDIYSLGAMLYALLTGEPPFASCSVSEALRRAGEEGPPPPRALDRSIPADLEAICLRCLEKEPADRYSGAGDLMRDLESFLAGQPVTARPVSTWSRTMRKLKRRRKLVAAVALVAATFVFMAYRQTEVRRNANAKLVKVAQEEMWRQVRAKRAQGKRSDALGGLTALTSLLAEADKPDRFISNAEVTAEAMEIWSLPEARSSFIQPGQSLGVAFSTDGERVGFLNVLWRSNEGSIQSGVLEVRGVVNGELIEKLEVEFEKKQSLGKVFHPPGMPTLGYPAGRIGQSTVAVFDPQCGCLRQHEVRPEQALLAPYFRWRFGAADTFAYLSSDFRLSLVDGNSNRAVRMPANPLVFPSSNLLYIYMDGLKSLNLQSYEIKDLTPAGYDFLASSQDQSTVLVRKGEDVAFWNTENQRVLSTLDGLVPNVSRLKLSSDGSLLAVSRKGGPIEIYSSQSPQKAPTMLQNTVGSRPGILPMASFSPDNRLFALSGEEEGKPVVWIWDVLNGERLHVLKGQVDLLWNPTGTALATYGALDEPHVSYQIVNGSRSSVSVNVGVTMWQLKRGPGVIQVMQPKSRQIGSLYRIETSPESLESVHFADRGDLAASSETWRLERSAGQPVSWAAHWSLGTAESDELGVRREWVPDGAGHLIAMESAALGETVADLSGEVSFMAPEKPRPALIFLSMVADGPVRIGEPGGVEGASLFPESHIFSHQGTKLWMGGSWMRSIEKGYDFVNFTFDLWDAITGERVMHLSDEHVTRLVLSPDGRHVAAGGLSRHGNQERGDDGVAVWSSDGEKIVSLPHDGLPEALTWSVDGKILITGHADGLFQWTRLSEAMEAQGTEQWDSDLGRIRGLATDGGGRILAVDEHGTLLVWSLEAGSPRENYRIPVSEVGLGAVAFHEPSGLAAMGDEAGRLHLFDLSDFERFLSEHSALHHDS